jgi:hypothetical protein
MITEKMARPVTTRGFGLVAKFDAWLAQQQRQERPTAMDPVDHSRSPKLQRPASPAAMALLMDETATHDKSDVSPDDVVRMVCSTTAEATSVTWKCSGCHTTDMSALVKNQDSSMSCSRCSVVAFGVQMKSTCREKACESREDKTQHADEVGPEVDRYREGEVESASAMRERHMRDAGGCVVPTKMLKRHSMGSVDAKLKRKAGSEHRKAQEELSALNTARNRSLQIELMGLFTLVQPVDKELQRHVRMTAHELLLRSQQHEEHCAAGCAVTLAGVSTGLLSKVLLRVLAETLLPLHGQDCCPVRLDCSRDELTGLVDRCNRLVHKEGVHSALCRTSIDLLLNADHLQPCSNQSAREVEASGVMLAKNESKEVLNGDAKNSVRDALWSLHKTKTISDPVRDGALRTLSQDAVCSWIVEEAQKIQCDIVALRLARAVCIKLNGAEAVAQSIAAAIQRACQRNATSATTIAGDHALEALINTMPMNDGEEDSLM